MGTAEDLVNRAAIADVVVGLAHAQDDRNWGALHDLFADELTLDLATHYYGRPVARMAAGDLVELARTTLTGFDCTHHATSNLVVELSGERARCRTHVVAYHHVPAAAGVVDYCTMRGYWELELRKTGQRWVIQHWSVIRTAPWEGSPEVYQLAAARR